MPDTLSDQARSLIGRPVLASRSGAIPEILTGRFAGHLFEKGDAAGLAVLLRNLRGWQDRDPALAARCTAHVEERFQLSDRVDALEVLLADASGPPGADSRPRTIRR